MNVASRVLFITARNALSNIVSDLRHQIFHRSFWASPLDAVLSDLLH
jgi:hypothetical protein